MKKPHALIGLLAALGTAIGVLVAVVGLPYGRLNYTAFAGLYHGPTTAANIHVSLDCDTGTSAIDAVCSVPNVPGTRAIGVHVGNQTPASILLGGFNFNVFNPNTALVTIPGVPALNVVAWPSPDWACTPPAADNDTGAYGVGTTDSYLGCIISGATYDTLATGTEPALSTLTYGITGATGSVTLNLFAVAVADDSAVEVAACNSTTLAPIPPVIGVGEPCFDTTLNIEPPPTSTPAPPTDTPTVTNTPVPNTATNTPTNTPTATNTPQGAVQFKVPEGSVSSGNVDLSVPKANLFICVTGPCAGPGEGDLKVVEKVINVTTGDSDGDLDQDGLGAYEFNVEYDNFIIQSVNPSDIVFAAGGAGATRGPANCSFSLVLENKVRFGCVTIGSSPDGPIGNFDLAQLDLVPHPDLMNDLFPGNDNGAPTVIKDNGCELADVFGHPVLGSVGGGLLATCGDLAVTVRILEGDLNLDCTVNVTDEALIAYHYAAVFGSTYYSTWFDLEPRQHDLDIDIKDLQKVFGRDGSTCQNPIPQQTPVNPGVPFGG